MTEALGALENILLTVARFGSLVLELSGVLIILCTAVRCAVSAFQHKKHISTMLSAGVETALEFMLAGEILRTVVSQDLKSLLLVGLTALLRAAMTVLILWKTRRTGRETPLAEEKIEKKLELLSSAAAEQ